MPFQLSAAGRGCEHEVGEEQGDESDASPRAYPTRLIAPVDLVECLRLFLQLPYFDDDDAKIKSTSVDAQAFVDWCLAGVTVCSVSTEAPEPWTPAVRVARSGAEAFVLRLLFKRHSGNITHAAASGQTSRRAFRDGLKKHGLYCEPGTEIRSEADYPQYTWKTVSSLRQLAATTHGTEKTLWEQAANAAIFRIRQAGKQASRVRAAEILKKFADGMTDIVVATVIPGPVRVSLINGRVQIDLGGEITDAGTLAQHKALSILTKALTKFGGPVESAAHNDRLDTIASEKQFDA